MSEPLFLRALRGEATPRRPLWLMRQAGRILPAYRALRERYAFETLCASPELAAEITLLPLERFPFDAAIVFADLLSPAPALGLDVRFEPGPRIDRPLRSAAAVRALPRLGAGEIAPEVASALRLVKARLPHDVALIGFAGSPWSLGAYLVEGRGGAGFARFLALLGEDRTTFDLLMERLTESLAIYLVDQHRAGADVVQVFDTWAGLVPPATWRDAVLPHVRRLLEATRDAGVPTIYFPRGAPGSTDDHLGLPCAGLSLCPLDDLAAVRARAPGDVALQGNLEPAVLLDGPDATARAVRALFAAMPARGHLVNLGHGVLPATPLESIDALVHVVRGEEVAS